jgi:formyltetrahydrofolate-dependent phosphoribosylglycinamide formyltransferase
VSESPLRLVVMASGSGSNFQAIIDAIANQTLNAEIVLLAVNRKSAYALERAKTAGIPTLYFPLRPYLDQGHSREAYDAALAEQLQPYAPNLIVLAGWMHVLSPAFLDVFPQRVINLHPALPEQFAGVNAIERAFAACEAGEIDHSGCMVHYAIPEVDAGAVIAQQVVPYVTGDRLEDFATRMHAAEHALIVAAIRQFAAVK